MPEPIVLHVASDPITLARLVKPLATRQRKAGWAVRFASGPGEHQRALVDAGFEVRKLPFSRRASPWAAVRATVQFRGLLEREPPTIVHVHNAAAALPVMLASGRRRRHKVLYHVRGSLWDTPRTVDRLLFTLSESVAARYADYALTLNQLDAEELVARGLLPRERVQSLGCGGSGVDLAEYRRSDSAIGRGRAFRKSWDVAEDAVVVGFIGRVVQEKGVLELVEAARLAQGRVPALRLAIVGPTLPSDRDQRTARSVAEMARELPMLVLAGHQDDVPGVLAAFDILALPSHREGFGMVLAEASAMEVPVISTATRGATEAVAHGETGVVVPIRDVPRLAEAVTTLAEDAALRSRLGAAGRRRAEAQFGEAAVCGRIAGAYGRLLPGAPKW
jgi:glycosyltransferase involved in cell wall biosynthesis